MRAEDTNIDRVLALMVGCRMENVYPKEEIEIGEPLLEVKDLKNGQLFEDGTFHVNKGEIDGFAGLVVVGIQKRCVVCLAWSLSMAVR